MITITLKKQIRIGKEDMVPKSEMLLMLIAEVCRTTVVVSLTEIHFSKWTWDASIGSSSPPKILAPCSLTVLPEKSIYVY